MEKPMPERLILLLAGSASLALVAAMYWHFFWRLPSGDPRFASERTIAIKRRRLELLWRYQQWVDGDDDLAYLFSHDANTLDSRSDPW